MEIQEALTILYKLADAIHRRTARLIQPHAGSIGATRRRRRRRKRQPGQSAGNLFHHYHGDFGICALTVLPPR